MAATGEWIVLTNQDNVFMLGWLDLIAPYLDHNTNGFVYWNGISNLAAWTDGGGSEPRRGRIDLSFAATRTAIAQKVGFPGREYDSDWEYLHAYLEEAKHQGLGIHHVKRTLSVHN